MNVYKWLIVIAGVLLVCGLSTAFISSRYTERFISEGRNGGVVIWTPDPDNPSGRPKSVLSLPELWFYVGMVLTGLGGVLFGIALPLFLMKIRRRNTQVLRNIDKQGR
jgi:hypothetical protein